MNRLFVALDMSPEAKDELLSVQKKLPRQLAKITWVAKKKFHLTLKFLGDAEDAQIPLIIERLNNIKFKKFKLNLGKIGFFPDLRKGDLRVIWVSVAPENDLIKLQLVVDEQLLDLFPSEQKFQAHLTLGRVKAIKKPKEFTEEAGKIAVKPISFEITDFKLYNSRKVGGGQIYNLIKEFQLS